MASKKEVVAVAGVGDLGKYICEEFFASPDFTPVVLTRNVSLPSPFHVSNSLCFLLFQS